MIATRRIIIAKKSDTISTSQVVPYQIIYNGTFVNEADIVQYEYYACYGCTIQESISNDGTYYIDTNYKTTNNTKIILECSISSNSGFVCGCNISSSGNDMYSLFLDPSTQQVYAEFGTSENIPINYNIEYNKKYKIDISQNGLYINDTLVKSYDDVSFTSDNNMYIFSCNDENVTSDSMLLGNIYSFKIYESEKLVRHILPCIRDSDSSIGMVDVINGTFYSLINKE